MQHFQGIKINEKAETNIEGLYACGEAAGGQHGLTDQEEILCLTHRFLGKYQVRKQQFTLLQ